ncbi:MAG: nucleotide exchange factor GrpE [Phycisphaerae bacterium]|nr:nucleotide exchange factor GrpE [Phycisphaerae bacterium]
MNARNDTTPREPDAGDELEQLRARVDELEQAVADADNRYKHALADHQNYVRRALQNEAQARMMGVRAAVESLIPTLDHFDHALAMDPESASAQSVIGGVRLIRDEVLKALAAHGVTLVCPERGEEFTPGRHEAVMQQKDTEFPAGRVLVTLQPGYALGDRIVRAAKVIVSSDPTA